MDHLRLLLLGSVDGTDVGEVYSGYKWVEALSDVAEVTLLSLQRSGRKPLAEQLPNTRVITWPEPEWLLRYERFNAMAKPTWPFFSRWVRRWLRDERDRGNSFDIAHQILPQAMRFTSPFYGMGIPYLIGPLGGGLTTPPAFKKEVESGISIVQLRRLDQFRFKYDFRLRRSYSEAAAILGVAPYAKTQLKNVKLNRFEVVPERAFEQRVTEFVPRPDHTGLKLLHVGRAVRTKGLRDVVRAMGHLKAYPDITLTSAGDGPDLDTCKQEAAKLGVAGQIEFLGKISRENVDELYATHDVFAFPSFREPMGGVVFEALQAGLPVIAADAGGPGYIIDESCGLKVEITSPEKFALDISNSILRVYEDPNFLKQIQLGTIDRINHFGTWSDKATTMIELYKDVIRGGTSTR